MTGLHSSADSDAASAHQSRSQTIHSEMSKVPVRHSPTEVCGPLWKKGPHPFSLMKRRMFTLSGSCVQYHVEGQRRPRGSFRLKKGVSMKESESVRLQYEDLAGVVCSRSTCRYVGRTCSGRYRFTVAAASGRTFVLEAESEISLRRWMSCFGAA